MEITMEKIQLILSVIGGSIMASLGGCDTLLMVLIGFVAVDYISGILLAIKNGTLNSKKGFLGLAKKGVIFLVVFLAQLLDNATGLGAIRSMTVLFYISNEGISVLENLGKLDIKYPQKLKDILEQLEDKDEHKDDNESDNK